jgi:rubredoxin
MTKAKCKICGYIYDPEVGEERKNVAPNTDWPDVPKNFRCPSCGAGKKAFVEL